MNKSATRVAADVQSSTRARIHVRVDVKDQGEIEFIKQNVGAHRRRHARLPLAAGAEGVRRAPSVLFVCTGNICRSPTAEGCCGPCSRDAGLAARSTRPGLIGAHVGDPPDPAPGGRRAPRVRPLALRGRVLRKATSTASTTSG
jgi:hypothetical protein